MIYILGILCAAIVGVTLKIISDRTNTLSQITRTELIVGLVVCSLVVVPLTVWAGTKIAVNNNLTYKEYWSGYELKANKSTERCSRDSGCHFTYNCDPYTHTHTRTVTVSDGKGGTTTRTETYTETHWHSCPYADREETFDVDTTLGNYHMGTRVPHDANGFRGRSIPGRIPRGEPKVWAAARDRLAVGDHGPVTKRMEYKNYILASQETILKKYSDAIAKYKEAKQLPRLATTTRDYYYADKVYTVGLKLDDKKRWIRTVNRFNAAFGSDLQGDLHVVIFDSKDIKDPNEFMQATYAYWQSDAYEKDALSKNALVVFIGTSDKSTVDWAGAVTGMPVGNTQLLQQIRSGLRGESLHAPTLIGVPEPVISKGKVDGVVLPNGGKLATMVWGVNKFERVCMECAGTDDKGTGFGYLVSNVELTGWQKFWIFFISLLTSCIVWGILLLAGDSRNHARNARLVRSRYL